MDTLENAVRLRRADYINSLRLWEEGYLTPTQPDEDERRKVKEHLRVGIDILSAVLVDAGLEPRREETPCCPQDDHAAAATRSHRS